MTATHHYLEAYHSTSTLSHSINKHKHKSMPSISNKISYLSKVYCLLHKKMVKNTNHEHTQTKRKVISQFMYAVTQKTQGNHGKEEGI